MMFFKFPNGGQRVDRVSGKSTNGFGDDQIDLSMKSIIDHPSESFTMGGAGAADAFICVDIDIIPVSPFSDHVFIVGNLGFIAALLFIPIGRNPGISGHVFSGNHGLNSVHCPGYRDFSYLNVFSFRL